MIISSVMGISGFISHVISNEVNFLYIIALGPSAMLGGFFDKIYKSSFSNNSEKINWGSFSHNSGN